MITQPDLPAELFVPPADLPWPRDAAAHCRERSMAYFAALDAARQDRTAAALWAASWAAMDLHTSYSFVGTCCHGPQFNPLGQKLLRHATELKVAAEQVDPSMAWWRLPARPDSASLETRGERGD